MRVLVFGDSIAQGFTDTLGGWVARLVSHFNKKIIDDLDGDWVEVFNLGISGDTTDGILGRLENEIKARRLYEDDEILVISVGTNDSVFRANVFENTDKKFEEKITQLLSRAQEMVDKVIVVGLPGVDDSKCNPWLYSSTGKSFTNARIKKFDQIIQRVCESRGINFIDINQPFQMLATEREMFADGLHPNDDGHNLVFQKVLPALEGLIK